MAQVKIIIKGIAMSYHKNDGVWKFIFPFADQQPGNCHTVRLTVGDGQTVSLAEAGRKIEITAVNPASVFGIGNGYEKFLDLTADYSHRDGVLVKDDWKDRSVFLSIENAVFSLFEPTQSRYSLELGGQTTMPPTYIGYSGAADIEAEEVLITISGMETISLRLDATVIFDNTCGGNPTDDNADFQMVYYAVRDSLDAAKEFILVRDSNDMPTGVGNPVADNPGPGQAGLPCNKVRISQPGNLP